VQEAACYAISSCLQRDELPVGIGILNPAFLSAAEALERRPDEVLLGPERRALGRLCLIEADFADASTA
jgi:hypothetical protein